jgi:hypothetical protein
MPNHWLLGAAFNNGTLDQSVLCVKGGYWENGYQNRYLDVVKAVQVGDWVAIKACFSQKNNLPFNASGNWVGAMRIKARGRVLENPGDGRRLVIDWEGGFVVRDIFGRQWQSTISRVDPGPWSDVIRWVWESEGQTAEDFQRLEAEYPAKTPVIPPGPVVLKDDPPVDPDIQFPPTNRILHGPPGTGKTYATVLHAVSLADGIELDLLQSHPYEEALDRYRELVADRRIQFVTVHPSLAYEDFVQGLRPVPAEGGIRYEVRPGIFMVMAKHAVAHVRPDNLDAGQVNEVIERLKSGLPGHPLTLRTLTQRRPFLVTYENGTAFSVHPEATVAPEIMHRVAIEDIRRMAMGGAVGGTNWSYGEAIADHIVGCLLKPSGKGLPKGHVLILDEINRGNLASMLGELITLLEPDKRAGQPHALEVTLAGDADPVPFTVPSNLHILGTMNTADRSVEALDIALRRRFTFVEMPPDLDLLRGRRVGNLDLGDLLEAINTRLHALMDRDHRIGHAYFLDITSLDELREAFHARVIPLLQEYFYGEWRKIGMVLGGAFVRRTGQNIRWPRGFEDDSDLCRDIWEMVPHDEWTQDSFHSVLALA